MARDLDTLTAEAGTRQTARLAEKKDITVRISETTRTLAFGSLASCYALLFANTDLAAVFAGATPLLQWSAVFGVLAIIVDATQYLFAFVSVQQALTSDDQLYPRNQVRRGRAVCFVLKQIFAFLAALMLLVAIASTLLARTQEPPSPQPKPPPLSPQTVPAAPSRGGPAGSPSSVP